MFSIPEIYKVAMKASIEAGRAILDIYENNFEVYQKEDDTPVTKADFEANTIITKALHNTEIPIISEESEIAPYEIRKNWMQCWMVDPLDGTREFVNRNGDFTVNIALIEDSKPMFGVIYVPIKKTLYFGGSDLGYSYKFRLDDDFNLNLNDAEILNPKLTSEKKIKALASRSYINAETQEYLDTLKEQHEDLTVLNVGSSLKFCLLAEGTAHLYPRYGSIMEWDTAAGQAICESVGISVLNAETNLPLVYNKANLKNPSFVARIN